MDGPRLPQPGLPVACVKLETDFEQSIDAVQASQRRLNGRPEPRKRRSHRDPDYRDGTGSEDEVNGHLSPEKRRRSGARAARRVRAPSGGGGGGGKPFSHQMSLLPRSRLLARVVAPPPIPEPPASGKPRSMMVLSSKKKQSKKERVDTYHSQISEDCNTIKIRIRKGSSQLQVYLTSYK